MASVAVVFVLLGWKEGNYMTHPYFGDIIREREDILFINSIIPQ